MPAAICGDDERMPPLVEVARVCPGGERDPQCPGALASYFGNTCRVKLCSP